MPENALPPNETATGWLYQPPRSGGRATVTMAVGLEISTWILYGNAILGGAGQLTSHSTIRLVSPLNGISAVHAADGTAAVIGLNVQLRSTGVVYHPDLHWTWLPESVVHKGVTVFASATPPAPSKAPNSTTPPTSPKSVPFGLSPRLPLAHPSMQPPELAQQAEASTTNMPRARELSSSPTPLVWVCRVAATKLSDARLGSQSPTATGVGWGCGLCATR